MTSTSPGVAALHVARPAAVELAVVHLAGERIAAPRSGAERHHVDVAGEAEGRLAGGAGGARDEAGPARREVVRGDGEARGLEQARQVLGARALVAGRVDGVEADQVTRQLDGVHGASSISVDGLDERVPDA
jgi:hypothetical protein